MNRASGLKVLDCAACAKPTRAGAEAARVLCDACAAAGRDFPRARQLELFDRESATAPAGDRADPAVRQAPEAAPDATATNSPGGAPAPRTGPP